MNSLFENMDISKNQPLYLYQQPMFMLTVSVVLIHDNRVLTLQGGESIIKFDPVTPEERAPDIYYVRRFPGGLVRAGQETIQFAAVRHIKEQTGLRLSKEALIPVDFRSSPERSKEGNVVDIGMVCMLNNINDVTTAIWEEVDFENKKIVESADRIFYMDHDVLLNRAIDIVCMVKD